MKVVDGQKYKETERNEQIENNQFNSKDIDKETDKYISQIQKKITAQTENMNCETNNCWN